MASATEAEVETPEGEGEGEGKKLGKKKLIIIAVLVLAIVGAAGSFLLGGDDPAGKSKAPKTTTTVTYPELGTVQLDKVTVSLPDNTVVQFELGVIIVNKKPDKGETPPEFTKEFSAEKFKAADGVRARAAAAEAMRKFSHEELSSLKGQDEAVESIEKAVIAEYNGWVSEVKVVGFIIQA